MTYTSEMRPCPNELHRLLTTQVLRLHQATKNGKMYVAQCVKQMMSARKQRDPLTCTIEMHPCLNEFHRPGTTQMLRLKQEGKNGKIQYEYYQYVQDYSAKAI